MIIPMFDFYPISGISSFWALQDKPSLSLIYEDFSLLSSDVGLTFSYPVVRGKSVLFSHFGVLLPHFMMPTITSGTLEDFSYEPSFSFVLGGTYGLNAGPFSLKGGLSAGGKVFSGSFSPDFSADMLVAYLFKKVLLNLRLAYSEMSPLVEIFGEFSALKAGLWSSYRKFTYADFGVFGIYGARLSGVNVQGAGVVSFSPVTFSLLAQMEKDKIFATAGFSLSSSEVFPYSFSVGFGFKF